ncbi:Gluconolactonase precursor [Caulifigura coniformis]|uniref:Gluconolactonase n=1 Tax=Caulifigura coniformis TaxID=2527983 RepID=A0A517SDL6_9PLAN|nr:alpha/beta hydrolase-fold protein [Caulifigura coniformis]QDT54216.1 Gluconolactonase precursor [Caulifigura coniformis]
MKRFVLCFVLAVLATAVPAAAQSASRDREKQPNVPAGKTTSGVFTETRIFPGTRRDYSVYVPAQYTGEKPAALMVFMDGATYAKPDGAFRVPVVFDNLIQQGAMPVTIAVFVNPGMIPATKPDAKDRSNRSLEYDSLGNRYAKFLVDEFLPVALKGLNVSTDPKQRAVCGISSGGICAFTVAWEKPDQFGKVMSHIGSFTDIRGGWAYAGLVRKSKSSPKAIKVFLQEGKDDLNNLFGNWPLANRDLSAALQFAGYEHQFVMTDGGHNGNAAGTALPDALRWLWSDQAKTSPAGGEVAPNAKPTWTPHPDAVERTDVAHGTIEEMPTWESKIFPGTTREWSIYVPAQYRKETPAALMVFQDGSGFRNPKGRWRVPVVFDNLIARGDMPPTIAVFINPGHDRSKNPDPKAKPSNRGFEYDSLGDRYARFLLEEILPEVEKKYSISKDPEMRAICGSSSGGICAFTVAWERPEAFRKVLTNVGSFVNLRGGDIYASLIRKTEQKPLRVYMADTSGDLDNPFGNWPLANQQMNSALTYMGYDVRFDWAEGYGHNADFGGAQFPEALKWLWRKEKFTPTFDTKGDLRGDMTLLKLLVPGQTWEVVAENLGFADAPCTDAEGNFYYSDMKAPAVYKVAAADGKKTVIAKESISGLEFGPDGLLYGCQGAKSRVISLDPRSGEVKEVATGVTPNDLAITRDGFIFITETKDKKVTRISIKSGEKVVADTGISRPNGIAVSNDQGTLAVSDSGGEIVWTFRVNADGSLDSKLPTMTMRLPIDPKGEFKFNAPPPYLAASKGDGMAVDRAGRYYVTSALGVQVFDATGRLCGVLPKPKESQPLTSCLLAGVGHDFLYVTNGDTVYRRKLKVE